MDIFLKGDHPIDEEPTEASHKYIPDPRAVRTQGGGDGFVLPDYFDELSSGATGEIFEAVEAILDRGDTSMIYECLDSRSTSFLSPSHEAFVHFLRDTIKDKIMRATIH